MMNPQYLLLSGDALNHSIAKACAINRAWSFGKQFPIRPWLGTIPGFNEKHISDKELDNAVSYLKPLKKNP